MDHVHYTDELPSFLTGLGGTDLTLLTLSGTNTDSDLPTLEAAFDGIEAFRVDSETLHPVICELRVLKTEMAREQRREESCFQKN